MATQGHGYTRAWLHKGMEIVFVFAMHITLNIEYGQGGERLMILENGDFSCQFNACELFGHNIVLLTSLTQTLLHVLLKIIQSSSLHNVMVLFSLPICTHQEKVPGRNKLRPVLLGISREGVMRLDTKTKAVLQTWPLTTILNYPTTPSSFSLVRGWW